MKLSRVYRVRTNGYTVRYNHWGPRPHTQGLIPYPIDLCQIGNTIIIIFVNICGRGENIYPSLSIHSLSHIHWSIIHTNTFLINYSFIPYYSITIQCRHSFKCGSGSLDWNNTFIPVSTGKTSCKQAYHAMRALSSSNSTISVACVLISFKKK